MNTLNNLFIKLKIQLDSLASAAFNILFNQRDYGNEIQAKMKLRDCINRANNAYRALTGYTAPKAITQRQLEDVVLCSSNFAELKENLEWQCATKDSIYIILLTVSVANVYKPKRVPEITGGNNIKFLK